MESNVTLSPKDRALFIYLFKILKNQGDEEYDYDNMIKALQFGYEYHYGDVFDCLFDDVLSVEGCKEVLDVLEMYRGITFSYIKLQEGGRVESLIDDDIRFEGFDGNNETKQMSYARYFIIDLDRYSEIQGYAQGYDYNSHCEKLPKYRAMLSKWKSYPPETRYSMTEEQIIDLLKAW